MKTNLTTRPTSHAAIASELCRIAGLAKRGHKPLEDLFDAAVDRLLATGSAADSHQAEIIYNKYADACQGFRAVGGNPDVQSTIAGVGEFSRRSSAGDQHPEYRSAIAFRFGSEANRIGRSIYHAPLGPALAPPTVTEICGPTAKQIEARKAFSANAAEYSAKAHAAGKGGRPRKSFAK